MSDEEAPVAPKEPEVVEPIEVPVRFVDWIVTGGEFDGVVNVVLGTIDHTHTASDGAARILVSSKLRMSRPFAENLIRALSSVLGTKTETPEPPKSPPPNRMH